MIKCKIRETLQSPWTLGKPHIGKKFEILAMHWVEEEDNGANAEPRFLVKLECGTEFEAEAEEVFSGWMDPTKHWPEG